MSTLAVESAELALPNVVRADPQEYLAINALDRHGQIPVDESCRTVEPNIYAIGHGMLGPTIMAHGTDEQKARYLPRICSGELLTAAAFTEPDVGSDTAPMKLRAKKVGGGYELFGEKTWCTWARKSPLPTSCPSLSTATCPEMNTGVPLFLTAYE